MKELYDYFDFVKLWEDIRKSDLDYLDDIDIENLKELKNFIKNPSIDLCIDQCEIGFINNDLHVIFDFSEEFNTANESNNQNEWISVTIDYNFDNEMIESYDYQQG